jgi:hypothetical protein
MALPALDELREVTLDLSTLTLGEAAEAERQAQLSLGQIASSPINLKLLAMFVHGLRNYVPAPSWQELSSLRLFDVSSSSTPRTPAAASQTSND